MLYEWHWTTYILYVLVGVVFCNCLRHFRYHDSNTGAGRIKRHRGNEFVFMLIAYLALLSLPVFRDIDIYPAYEDAIAQGIRTIDPQGYIWQIMKGDNPGFHLKEMLSFQQTEPLFYTIAQFVLKLGGNITMVWLVIFSLVITCYIYCFQYTMDKDMNYLLLFPFVALFLYSMHGIRSGLSFAFFYAALANRKRRKKAAMVICLCVGFCFHSLIVFGVVGLIFEYFFQRFLNKKYIAVLVFLVITAMTILLKSDAAGFIANTKYRVYLEGDSLTLIGQTPELLIFVLCLIHYDKLKKKCPDRMLFVNLVIFGALCVPFVIIFGAYRVNMYFLIPRIYVWNMLIGIYAEKYRIAESRLGVRLLGKNYYLYDLCGAAIAFLWFTKQIYDMRGIGIMPLFNLYI